MSQIFVGRDGIYELEDDGTRRLLTRSFASLDRMDPPRDYLWSDPSGHLLCVTKAEFRRLRWAQRLRRAETFAAFCVLLLVSYAALCLVLWRVWRLLH